MTTYDHTVKDKRWLPYRLRTKAAGLLWRIWTESLNAFEAALEDIEATRSIATATGVVLDLFGFLAGLSREGLDDDTYRVAIIVQAIALFGSGDPSHIHRLLRMIAPGATITITETPPHAFAVYMHPISGQQMTLLAKLLADVPALTINGQVIVWDGDVLAFDSPAHDVGVPGLGAGWFSSANPDHNVDGVGMAHVIQL